MVTKILEALVYREIVWFKRFAADYIVSWILPLAFSLGVVFLPATISNINTVVSRMSSLYNYQMDLKTAYSLALAVTGIVNIVAVTVNDVIQTMFSEFRFMEVGWMILETTGLVRYSIANAIIRPAIMTPLTTLYLAPILIYLHGLGGLATFAVLEAAFEVTAIALGLYATVIAVPLTFYTRVSRPWTITNVLAPAILAGAGVYIPVNLVPAILRFFAYTTPVPRSCEIVYLIAIKGVPSEFVEFMAISSFAVALYVTLSGLLSKNADIRVRRGLNMRRILHVLYIGFVLSRMHITSYIASIASSVLWFTIMFVPTVIFSGHPLEALSLLLPGVYALAIASAAMWTSTEFLRWNVYHGLTDLYRENGLTVFHYLLSNSIVDSILFGVSTYILSAYIVSSYLGIEIFAALPKNYLYLFIAIALAIPTYLLVGSIIGYLMASTSISGSWVNIIQMIIAFGTIVPPKAFPNAWILLANPPTIVAEILRIGYNSNAIPSGILIVIGIIMIFLYTALGYIIGVLCDRRIARHGLEYRF